MKDEVIRLLGMPKNEETIKALSELCGIEEFQASNLIDEYKKIYDIEVDMLSKGMDTSNYAKEKQAIIRGLTSGEYSKPEVVIEDLKKEIQKILQGNDVMENANSLARLCNLSIEEANALTIKFKEAEAGEKLMIAQFNYSSEYTTQKWDIINSLVNIDAIKARRK